MRKILAKLLRWTVYIAAAGVMLLALLVGLARLLLPLVPDYQNDIKRWAGEATGLEVEFEYISASWPLAGPELKFFDVTISTSDGEPILNADSLTIGVSVVRLLMEHQVNVNRVGIGKTRLEVQNGPGGSFLFQGRPIGEIFKFETPPDEAFSLPELRIEIEDTDVVFADIGRTDSVLNFFVERLEFRLSDEGIALDGEVQLDQKLGRKAELSLDLPIELLRQGWAPDEAGAAPAVAGVPWSGYLAGTDLQVDRILEFALAMEVPLQQARGDVVIWGEFAGFVPKNTTIEIDLENVEFSGAAGEVEAYESFSGQFEWGRSDDGWVLGGSDLRIVRADESWPESEFTVAYRPADASGMRHITGDADFLRLHDIYPILLALASEEVRSDLLPRRLSGDLSNFDLNLWLDPEGQTRYELETQFENLGIAVADDGKAMTGISGAVVADQLGGRLQIDSDDAVIELPQIFKSPLETESIDGFLIWRVTKNRIRVLSDNIQVRVPYASGNTRFELNLPRNGDSPRIDLTAFFTLSDAPRILRFLPTKKLKPKLVAWLERAIVAGRVTGAQVELSGALREFPYDHGEGVFKTTINGDGGIVDYAKGWPRAEEVSAQLVFDGVSLTVNRNSGRVGGVPFSDAKVHIDDLRDAVLEISNEAIIKSDQMLGFLRASPIAEAFGPVFSQLSASGEMDTRLSVMLPIKRLKEYKVQVDADLRDTTLDIEGLGFGFTELNGMVRVRNTKVFADRLTARLLDQPVTARVWPAADVGGPYTHFATVYGSTPIDKWTEALDLPFADRLEGRIGWEAMALIPAGNKRRDSQLHILARSDLVGVTSTFPAPFDKLAGSADGLELDIAFPEAGALEISGSLRREISWALRLLANDDRWQIERGAVHSGTAAALLPSEAGVELSGRIDEVRFDDWLALAEGEADSRWQDLYREADFNIDRFYVFGQAFPEVEIAARREAGNWQVDIDSLNLAGSLSVPLSPDEPIDAKLERLWLVEEDPVDSGSGDPRNIQPANVRVDDFSMKGMNFGSLDLALTKVSFGVIADPIKTSAPSFSINGDAAWLVHPNDEAIQQSQLRLALQGNDINAMLNSLGYDPVMEGEVARVDADLTWSGSPGDQFLYRSNGTLNVYFEEGALLSLEPGGGRLLGVLSVAALPRRLSLDFSDVFDEGLGFDTLKGNFILSEGDAYTCNLSLEGSVADLGVVGRAGFEAEDYDQLAVVRPHVSNVLAIGGTVVGGPAVGAAMLLFSEIFRKPLSTLGESYYRVQGDWENPSVLRIQGDDLNLEPLKNCEQYLAAEIPRLSPE